MLPSLEAREETSVKIQLGGLILVVLSLSMSVAAQGSGKPTRADSQPPFQLTSTTFANGATLPISMINNNIVNGVNTCSLDGSPGGNESPALSWSNAPAGTASFVVTTYDSTAAFTHWGMYNIPSTATGLPENAGLAGSQYGSQIVNDF